MQEETNVMPSVPMLAVKDVESSARWYQEVLGFRHVFTIPGPGDRSLLARLRRARYADLLVVVTQKPSFDPKGVGVTLYLVMHLMDWSVDQLAEHARAKGANASGPVNQPWNTRELTVIDPDGYRLTVTQVINAEKGFDNCFRASGRVEGPVKTAPGRSSTASDLS